MKQPSLRSNSSINRSSANTAGKNAKQLTPPSISGLSAPSSLNQPLQAADDKNKKKPIAKKDAQLADDKNKKKPIAKKDAQLADDKNKKKPIAKKDAQLADDKNKKKPVSKKDDPSIQRKASSSPNKMPEHVQQKMESTMKADFSDVNIHVGSKASEVGALAYAQGNDIHFAQGKFNPTTNSGQALLGHELAHLVQQREGRVKANTTVNGLPVNNDKGLEREADSLGAKAAAAKV